MFIRGDPEGVIQWIGEEVEAFEEILSDRGDFCVFAGARGVAAFLVKIGCEHVKVATQKEGIFSLVDTKELSAEASLMGRKFYSDVWMKGGREMADEAIKKSEKESHDAREEAKRAEEAAERAMIIAGLSPPLEPYDPETDPVMKEALDVMKIANEVVDEVVDRLLHEAAEKILKED